ncbi:MAG: hypothetical protein HAW62_00205 [Endozoicomonadaceae bacterium]|nr:hypothetical protein [Endozoicomonadaceae bacterium]
MEKDYVADPGSQIKLLNDFCQSETEEKGILLITQVISIDEKHVTLKAPYFYNINAKTLTHDEILIMNFPKDKTKNKIKKRLTEAKDNEKSLVIQYKQSNTAFRNSCQSNSKKVKGLTTTEGLMQSAYNSITSRASNVVSSITYTLNKVRGQPTNSNEFIILSAAKIDHTSSADSDFTMISPYYHYQDNILINSFMKKHKNPEKDYHFVFKELEHTDGHIFSFNFIPSIDTPFTLDYEVCLVVIITEGQEEKTFQTRNAYVCHYLYWSSFYDNIIRIYVDSDGSDVVNQNLNLDPQITSIAGVFQVTGKPANSIISKPVNLDRFELEFL